jgi:hypothetical protein
LALAEISATLLSIEQLSKSSSGRARLRELEARYARYAILVVWVIYPPLVSDTNGGHFDEISSRPHVSQRPAEPIIRLYYG